MGAVKSLELTKRTPRALPSAGFLIPKEDQDKVEKLQHCIKCGNELPEQPGAGRPASYCSEVCRRLVEFELRRLDRRIDRYEIELRELLAEPRDYWGDDRPRRIKTLRRWIADDEKRLRVLAGGKPELKPERKLR